RSATPLWIDSATKAPSPLRSAGALQNNFPGTIILPDAFYYHHTFVRGFSGGFKMKRLCLLSLLLVFISATSIAQPTDARKPAVVETAKAKSEKDLEAERILRERRANAESILINLAADATRFNDQALRA